jgi:hypothetical protein
VYELALAHPNWPQAISNLSAIVPASPPLLARLERTGAWGVPQFDSWRWKALKGTGDANAAIAAGLALIGDYDRRRDPVAAGEAELELASYAGVTPACALALRHRASLRPGVREQPAPGGQACEQPVIVAHVA